VKGEGNKEVREERCGGGEGWIDTERLWIGQKLGEGHNQNGVGESKMGRKHPRCKKKGRGWVANLN